MLDGASTSPPRLAREGLREAPAPREQLRLRELHFRMYERQVPVLAVFEGWDAAGKGGAIKRVTETLEPRGYTVSSFSAPRGEEKTHHYLWRFWRTLPRAGHLGIFDRSYYGRVLVERVEGFCSEEEWRRAYREINEFEAHQASLRHGHPQVLAAHLARRSSSAASATASAIPSARTSSPPEDWRNRARWDEYEAAVEEMLARTSTAARALDGGGGGRQAPRAGEGREDPGRRDREGARPSRARSPGGGYVRRPLRRPTLRDLADARLAVAFVAGALRRLARLDIDALRAALRVLRAETRAAP